MGECNLSPLKKDDRTQDPGFLSETRGLAEDIAQAFGVTRQYLYELWRKFEADGVVDKRWGTAPRKRTTEREAQILRAKALQPQRGDSDLAKEFGLHRDTVYELLKEHGIQDLHRVLTDDSPESL